MTRYAAPAAGTRATRTDPALPRHRGWGRSRNSTGSSRRTARVTDRTAGNLAFDNAPGPGSRKKAPPRDSAKGLSNAGARDRARTGDPHVGKEMRALISLRNFARTDQIGSFRSIVGEARGARVRFCWPSRRGQDALTWGLWRPPRAAALPRCPGFSTLGRSGQQRKKKDPGSSDSGSSLWSLVGTCYPLSVSPRSAVGIRGSHPRARPQVGGTA